MTKPCEVCQKPADGCCSGLDVPELHFCDRHLVEHAAQCPDVKAGRSWISRYATTEDHHDHLGASSTTP